MSEWTEDKSELFEMLVFFHNHYNCPKCAEYSAFYLEGCKNPLHVLHDNLYRMEQEIKRNLSNVK